MISANISYQQERRKIYLPLPDNQKTISLPNPARPATLPMGLSVIAEYKIILFQIRQLLLKCGHVKQASNSQDTVDLYCAKGSKKK